MSNNAPTRYYTINQVAEMFGVTRATIDRWHRDRPDFPRKVSLGMNCARFRVADIENWIARVEGERLGV
ncbi:helix-turn-helix transcriptional regulator [Thioclava atlantica]|uniref:Putative restriction-modification system adenine methylase n=1 Tax=Thioclava atlantica TaxID=1317124 RepID=A0A085TXQ6_9RHOB|nr:helix-turn-helix domain-containing protein [Thioclava atlantica]KFE35503.1 putative restriction-modification system adenine methylase [Thioclava atlantica]